MAIYLSAFILLVTSTLLISAVRASPDTPLPKHRIEAHELAIIVNDRDPLSVQIAQYYRERRAIPLGNVVHVRFDPQRVDIPIDDFTTMRTAIEHHLPSSIQAIALTWARPYRVGCMSVTAAFTVGYDANFCAQMGCRKAPTSKLFDSPTVRPFQDVRMRPAMALAALNFTDAKALIDRGIQSDKTHPKGTVYLLSTSDRTRDVRSLQFEEVQQRFGKRIHVETLHTDTLRGKSDVLIYITGSQAVAALDTLHFIPGALADHLTSFGGQLTDSSQMSALRWLEAGATASYGTVVEPCNLPMKFPAPAVFLDWYLRGATVLEAYWKSVAWPWEGIFIGEPLASPFDGFGERQQLQ